MKKFLATILIAFTAFCFTGCSLLGSLITTTQEQDPNSYLIFAEMENLDGTYSTSFYLEIPESLFLEYGIAQKDVNAILPVLFAYEMVEKPYGITLGTTQLIGSTATWSDEDIGVNWVCEQASQDGAYCFQALMTFDDITVFLNYLKKGSVLGTKTMYTRKGPVEGGSRFDESMIFTSNTAFYRMQGVALEQPMKDVMSGWQSGFINASHPAYGAFWHGRGERLGLKTAFGPNADEAFAAITDSLYFCYQFVSSSFNGANGQYDKLTGMRSGLWGYKIKDTKEFPTLAKMYFRSPRLWVWYLVGAIVIAIIGLVLYVVLRNNEIRRAQRQAHRPYAAPFTSPVKPFEDYEKGKSTVDSTSTPFGDEYENKD